MPDRKKKSHRQSGMSADGIVRVLYWINALCGLLLKHWDIAELM